RSPAARPDLPSSARDARPANPSHLWNEVRLLDLVKPEFQFARLVLAPDEHPVVGHPLDHPIELATPVQGQPQPQPNTTAGEASVMFRPEQGSIQSGRRYL